MDEYVHMFQSRSDFDSRHKQKFIPSPLRPDRLKSPPIKCQNLFLHENEAQHSSSYTAGVKNV
jgi:hypothetical protein